MVIGVIGLIVIALIWIAFALFFGVVSAFMVGIEEEIFLINSGGTVIRMPVRGISSQGRDATGVRVMNLEPGQSVAAVAPVLQTDDE